MSNKCPECGSASFVNRQCADCAFTSFGQIVLTSEENARSARFAIATPIGGRLLRSFAGADAKFASDPQFTLLQSREHAAWLLCHATSAVNPTFVNGVPVSHPGVVISDGAIITIGPTRLRLRISIED